MKHKGEIWDVRKVGFNKKSLIRFLLTQEYKQESLFWNPKMQSGQDCHDTAQRYLYEIPAKSIQTQTAVIANR